MTISDETLPQIIGLWNAYKSAAEIGAVVGLTRNQVIGRIHRFKAKYPELVTRVEERTGGIRAVKAFREARMPMPKPAPILKVVIAEPDSSKRVSLLDIKGARCRFIMNDGLCCGETGFPWCNFHKQICLTHSPSTPESRAASEDAWKNSGIGKQFG